MRFKNFRIWRGRLPHWRADDVRYYVTFRHRRDLDKEERGILLKRLLSADGRRYDVLIACILPGAAEMIFTVREAPRGGAHELAEIVEGAKRRAGKDIMRITGELSPPFYAESYDRIIRDDAEMEERWTAILSSPVEHELVEDPEDYAALWVR